MKKLLTIVLLLVAQFATAQEARMKINWNFDWKFSAGDVAEAATLDFDDQAWRDVNLPHDFQIEQPWVAPTQGETADNSDAGANIKSRLSARGFKEMGIGWYRKSFTPDESWKNKRVLLDFEGIMLVGDVYLNGEHVGATDYGYLGFEVDVTRKLRWGEKNVVAVKADTRQPENSRWYTGGGLYRDVHVVVTDPQMHFTRHPLKITTESNKIVHVQAEAHANLNSRTKELVFGVKVYDADGKMVAAQKTSKKFYPAQKTNEYILDDIELENARLWDVDSPHLYKMEVTLYRADGSVADCITENFGVRTIEFSPDYGMKLNGRKVLLKGIANHHSLGALGAAVYPRAIEKRIQMIKDFGFNHIRTSHNPYSKSMMELCDKYGILVVDELYDKWLDRYVGGRRSWMELWQKDIPEFIKRDRNHPCVVVWSLGNELQQYWDLPYADWGVTAYKMQRELVKRYDTTRPITVAMHPRYRHVDTDSLPAPLAVETDIASYNYRYMYFPGDAKNYPHMIFYQSEANTQAMGPNYFEMDLDKVLGLAYWGMIDYLGESNGWPAKGWVQGVFDISLQPKPNAYFAKSYLDDEPMVHIGVFGGQADFEWNGIRLGASRLSENWNLEEGKEVTLHTYTNADEVELFVNGKSYGVQKNNKSNAKSRNKIIWNKVVYKPGNVLAIARNEGKEVARHQLQTTGSVSKLSVTPDQPEWKADGMDLQHVRLTAVDKKGRRVYHAFDKLRFEVEGDAAIVAVSNGDMNSHELNAVNERSLSEGTAMVILRSGRKPGNVTLRVIPEEGSKLKETKIQLKTL